MFSIIICSISPDRLQAVRKNIKETIGCEHEIISIDNRARHWPIARVYNEGARKAVYPYLFFVHEDVKFHTTGWGQIIAEKLQEADCGAIGFAGSTIKLKAYSGWGTISSCSRILLFQGCNQKSQLHIGHVYLERPFEEVVSLDGLGIFVRKDLWEKYPFDEKILTGFHCYDLDFSLQIAATKKYKNYVCSTPKIIIEHFSPGNYNKTWFDETIKLHQQKWNIFLPLTIENSDIDARKLKKMEERYFYKFIRKLISKKHPESKAILWEFLTEGFSWTHLAHSIGCLWLYLWTTSKSALSSPATQKNYENLPPLYVPAEKFKDNTRISVIYLLKRFISTIKIPITKNIG